MPRKPKKMTVREAAGKLRDAVQDIRDQFDYIDELDQPGLSDELDSAADEVEKVADWMDG